MSIIKKKNSDRFTSIHKGKDSPLKSDFLTKYSQLKSVNKNGEMETRSKKQIWKQRQMNHKKPNEGQN